MRWLAVLIIFISIDSHAFFGTELAPLLELVSGQVREIERLTEQVGLAKDQRDLLIRLNDGIERTVDQIRNIQSLVERAQGLDPRGIKSVQELNDYLSRVQGAKHSLEEILGIKSKAAGIIIGQSALQSETAYLMGQEMIATGSTLAKESETASPGRAQQISAASQSAQMLAQGVQLQTLSQIAQLQAMQLELQRSQIDQLIQEKSATRNLFVLELSRKRKTGHSRGLP